MSKQCPVCGSRKVNTFLQRKKAPVYQNLLHDTFSDVVNCDRGDLEMCICSRKWASDNCLSRA